MTYEAFFGSGKYWIFFEKKTRKKCFLDILESFWLFGKIGEYNGRIFLSIGNYGEGQHPGYKYVKAKRYHQIQQFALLG